MPRATVPQLKHQILVYQVLVVAIAFVAEPRVVTLLQLGNQRPVNKGHKLDQAQTNTTVQILTQLDTPARMLSIQMFLVQI